MQCADYDLPPRVTHEEGNFVEFLQTLFVQSV